MGKTAFTPMQPARRGAELLEAISPQLNTVPPATPQQRDTFEVTAEKPTLRPAPFVLRLSPTVFQEIDAKASAESVTMTVIIARALRDAGFKVPDDDLKDRRKRRFREAT